jgi:hypothetical protein
MEGSITFYPMKKDIKVRTGHVFLRGGMNSRLLKFWVP